jgi:SPP1 gp7 family putative phage head morphogenesis protein
MEVTQYRWSTGRDERVRESHRDLEESVHSWDDPPVVDDKTGRRAHPGQDYQCRCVPIPMVDELLDFLGEESAA